MTRIICFVLLSLLASSCLAQSQNGTTQQALAAGDTGLVPLASPYTISTAPHFAVLVQFPRADSIRRIALGDSNYFLAEADKDDPHYAIIKQIRATSAKPTTPIETNMLVYMASGRVVNILLKSGKLAEVRQTPKHDSGIAAGGLLLRPYRTERLGDLALVSFDVENMTKGVNDLEDPQINLVTAAEKAKDRKKAIPAKVEPIDLLQSEVSVKQLKPGERAMCVIAFKPPVHDSDQQVVLSVANRAMADRPVTYRIE